MSDKLDPDNILGASTDAGSKDIDESNQDLLGPKKSTSTRKKLYVLNEDVLLSSKGYPELLRQCQHFKFKRESPTKNSPGPIIWKTWKSYYKCTNYGAIKYTLGQTSTILPKYVQEPQIGQE